jgi:hypothetical protein
MLTLSAPRNSFMTVCYCFAGEAVGRKEAAPFTSTGLTISGTAWPSHGVAGAVVGADSLNGKYLLYRERIRLASLGRSRLARPGETIVTAFTGHGLKAAAKIAELVESL